MFLTLLRTYLNQNYIKNIRYKKMDLRDLVKLAGIVNPELLNRIETTAEVEEAEGAGFEQATTRPEEEMMDDPMQAMGSDVDTSLRRYLKAKGDHVSVDETVYPDHTVESVSEAYASFKEGSAEDEKAMRRAFDKADEPERGEKRKKVSLKKAPWEKDDDDKVDENQRPPTSIPQFLQMLRISLEDAMKNGGYYVDISNGVIQVDSDTPASFEYSQTTGEDEPPIFRDEKVAEIVLSLMSRDDDMDEAKVEEDDIDENAFNQAAAAASRAGKDSFEFGGKTHKTTMKKDTAHKLDDDIDVLKQLAGL